MLPRRDATTPATPAVSSFNHSHLWPHGVIPDLDTDVLEAICGSIDNIHDLLAVSRTCSPVWGIATREILQTHTIHLKSRKAIRSFHTLILNHTTTHAHYLHSLVIPEIVWFTGAPTLSNDVGCIMDVLDSAVKLDNLCLSFADEFREAPARISSAFAGLSALTSLSLIDPGRHWAHHALTALQAPLRTLSVHVEHKLNLSPTLSSSCSFQMFLRFSTSSTLTSLRLDQIPMYDNAFLDLPQFPSVRSLAITTPLQREPRLDALLHLFPSLDGTLYLRQDIQESILLWSHPTTLHDIQEENRHAQDDFRWSGLDRLDCSSETAGMLALRCPVRHLTMSSLKFSAIIGIRPEHLVVAALGIAFYLSPWRHLQTHAACPYTTHIVVISTYHSRDHLTGKQLFEQAPNFCWDTAFEHLMQDIALFRDATHVRLVFYFDKDGPCGDVLDRFTRDMRARASESAGPQSLAPPPHLLAACPALRHFFVTVAGRDDCQAAPASQRRWIHSRAWRVVEAGASQVDGSHVHEAQLGSAAPMAGTVLEELSDGAARRVIDAEELSLPEEWERKLEEARRTVPQLPVGAQASDSSDSDSEAAARYADRNRAQRDIDESMSVACGGFFDFL